MILMRLFVVDGNRVVAVYGGRTIENMAEMKPNSRLSQVSWVKLGRVVVVERRGCAEMCVSC